MTAEHRQLVEFYRELKALLSIDKYLAVSDYKALVPKYADLYNFFNAQKRAKTLSFYCSQNDLQENGLKGSWNTMLITMSSRQFPHQ